MKRLMRDVSLNQHDVFENGMHLTEAMPDLRSGLFWTRDIRFPEAHDTNSCNDYDNIEKIAEER